MSTVAVTTAQRLGGDYWRDNSAEGSSRGTSRVGEGRVLSTNKQRTGKPFGMNRVLQCVLRVAKLLSGCALACRMSDGCHIPRRSIAAGVYAESPPVQIGKRQTRPMSPTLS